MGRVGCQLESLHRATEPHYKPDCPTCGGPGEASQAKDLYTCDVPTCKRTVCALHSIVLGPHFRVCIECYGRVEWDHFKAMAEEWFTTMLPNGW